MDETGLERIKDGKQMFAIDQQPYLQGFLAVSLLNGYRQLRSRPPDETGPDRTGHRRRKQRRRHHNGREGRRSLSPLDERPARGRARGPAISARLQAADEVISSGELVGEASMHLQSKTHHPRTPAAASALISPGPSFGSLVRRPETGSFIGLIAVFVFFSVFGGENFHVGGRRGELA